MGNITHISKIEIKKLWGTTDIEWNLNDDVNILAGSNGSGKSTILSIIASLLFGSMPSEIRDKVEDAFVTFNKGKKISFSALKMKDEELANEFPSVIISTFDQELIDKESIQKVADEGVETYLDFEIYQLQKHYKDYQINIGKRAIEALSKGTNGLKEIDEKKNLFFDTIDRLFANTKKTIDRNSNDISFFLNKKQIIKPYQLSAGEKQIVTILLNALITDNKPCVIFMDEPEISLHTDWQEDLISDVRSLNKNAQIIIATHSPFIISKGWASEKYVFQVENLTK